MITMQWKWLSLEKYKKLMAISKEYLSVDIRANIEFIFTGLFLCPLLAPHLQLLLKLNF